MDEDESARVFTTMSDPELVEAVIDMLCNAMEYHLGYAGNYSLIDHEGKEWDKHVFEVFRYKGKHEKIVHEKEYAIFHVVI
jgi:hypothetical protein